MLRAWVKIAVQRGKVHNTRWMPLTNRVGPVTMKGVHREQENNHRQILFVRHGLATPPDYLDRF